VVAGMTKRRKPSGAIFGFQFLRKREREIGNTKTAREISIGFVCGYEDLGLILQHFDLDFDLLNLGNESISPYVKREGMLLQLLFGAQVLLVPIIPGSCHWWQIPDTQRTQRNLGDSQGNSLHMGLFRVLQGFALFTQSINLGIEHSQIALQVPKLALQGTLFGILRTILVLRAVTVLLMVLLMVVTLIVHGSLSFRVLAKKARQAKNSPVAY
jgi:hypothetical protein